MPQAISGVEQPDFGSAVCALIPNLVRYAKALTRDSVRADDLVQSTLVRALTKSHRWQPGTNLRAWLFTMMHNQFVNEIRSAVRAPVPVDIDDVQARLPGVDDPEARLMVKAMGDAIARLPEDQRRAIILVGYHGLTYERAAEYEGVPVGTIRSRLSRGRADLDRLMNGSELDDEDLDLLENWARK